MTPKKKWSESKTLDFVRTYRINDCLWDINHKDYKCRKNREIVCAKIGEAFNCSPNDVRRKIKSLRSVYCQERNKIKESISFNVNDIYVPSIIWYDEMDAVMNGGAEIIVADTTSFQLEHVEYMVDVDDEHEEQEDTNDCNKMSNVQGKTEIIWMNGNSEDGREAEGSRPHRLRKIRRRLASKKYDRLDSTYHKLKETSLNARDKGKDLSYNEVNVYGAVDKPNFSSVQEDEFDIFGRSVAQQLRNFRDIKTALRVQHKLQGILSEERIIDINNIPQECSSSELQQNQNDLNDTNDSASTDVSTELVHNLPRSTFDNCDNSCPSTNSSVDKLIIS